MDDVVQLVIMYGMMNRALQEFELLAYESACNLLKRYFDSQLKEELVETE